MVCRSCAAKSKGKSVMPKFNTKSSTMMAGKNFWGNTMSYKWADPTWHFFHSLAGKVHEDFYRGNTLQIFNIIRNINMTLPCPDCQKHAASFFKNIRYTSYPTKESFRNLLLDFHNDVNRRTGKELLPRSYLNKYDFSNFLVITSLFLNTMKSYRSHLGGGFSDTRRRDAMITNLRNWVNRVYMYFS